MDTKLEAQMHAQEARTANATIAEIYQLCSDATGEPGNWHGAEPVRAKLAALTAERDTLKALCVELVSTLDGCLHFSDGYISEGVIGKCLLEWRDTARELVPRARSILK